MAGGSNGVVYLGTPAENSWIKSLTLESKDFLKRRKF